VEEIRVDRKKIALVLGLIGFTPRDRYFVHPDTPYFVEFPAGPLAIGDEPVREISQLEYPTGLLRLLSATDCIKDRLAHYYHWQDQQCLDQAVMVAKATAFDLMEIERWSQHEGMGEEFLQIRELLQEGSK
jgi:hypothetical protein